MKYCFLYMPQDVVQMCSSYSVLCISASVLMIGLPWYDQSSVSPFVLVLINFFLCNDFGCGLCFSMSLFVVHWPSHGLIFLYFFPHPLFSPLFVYFCFPFPCLCFSHICFCGFRPFLFFPLSTLKFVHTFTHPTFSYRSICSITFLCVSSCLSLSLFLSFTLWFMAATLAFSLAAAAAAAQGQRLIAAPPGQVLPPATLRPPTPAGTPIMNIIRPTQMATVLPNGTPTLVPPTPDAGIIYTTPYDYPYALAPTSLLEYPIEHSGVLGKRAWGLGTSPFGVPHEGTAGVFYGGILDGASPSPIQDSLKGKYVTTSSC